MNDIAHTQPLPAEPPAAWRRLLSPRRRIGRLRYLAWSMFLLLIILPLFVLAVASRELQPAVGTSLALLLVLGFVVLGLPLAAQRLHDLGWPGWLCLLQLIPGINLLFALPLWLLPGQRRSNRFGAPPPANRALIAVLAVLWVLSVVLFLLILLGVGVSAAEIIREAQLVDHSNCQHTYMPVFQ